MAKLFLTLLSILLLFSLGSAYYEGGAAGGQQGKCRIKRINPQEPSRRLQAEGGVSEFWDHNSSEFDCAGASFRRHRIQPRGLILPSYHNAPVLAFIEQGQGIIGILISGCPETYESSQRSQEGTREEEEEEKRGQRFRDRHQRIVQFREGEVIAIPAGAAHWAYNDGDQELVVVAMHDTSNAANQLDQNPRSFMLAGGQERSQQQEYPQGPGRRGDQQQDELNNIFRGFDTETLAEAFGVDRETARSLQGENDERGHIVVVEKPLQVVRPPSVREEERRRSERSEPFYGGGRDNGLEETICSAKIKENIDRPESADVYNQRAGRFSTVNGLTLPILRFVRLSAARGILYRNAIMAPHWTLNAHRIIYITRGESRMQIVNHRGQAVFDGRVRKGQVVVVPQYFAVVKQAAEQGCEWVEFNTNDNAMINTLTGRTSALRGLPVDVVANAYQVSRDEAEKLKFSRRETLFFSGGGAKSERGRVASA